VDRATRVIAARVDGERRAIDRLGGRLAPTLPARLATDRARVAWADVLGGFIGRRLERGRSALASAHAALGVLGPQATLERGYAIVRRTPDGTILRDPLEAPAGTRLAIRVAGGELPATADER
jgi:exodeoxyribonuclease VII large subunit